MANALTSSGLLLTNIRMMGTAQQNMSTLSTQLTTEVKSQNMTDYGSSDAKNLMNYNATIDSKNGYLSVMNTISTRLQVYDTAMTSIESVASTASTAFSTAATYNSNTNAQLAQQITSYLQEVQSYLNEKVGDRYAFSGSRYTTAPVTDLTAIAVPTAPYTVASPAVPTYDADYDSLNPANPVTSAWTRNSAAISPTLDLSYGVTSTETGFQELISGLRLAYEATQDTANYDTYMAAAQSLLSTASSDLRAIHTRVTSANTTLGNTKTTTEDGVSTLQSQVSDLESVDLNEVSLKLTTYQSVLEASYSAIAAMTKLSIVNYL